MKGRALRHLFVGTVMGVGLSRIGFASWDEVHAMLTFQTARMHLVFGTTVVILFVMWRSLSRPGVLLGEPRPCHPGSVPGGLLFGLGWALTGACPSSVLVQIGEGQLWALLSLVGIFAGNFAFAALQGRVFRFNPGGSCLTDP